MKFNKLNFMGHIAATYSWNMYPQHFHVCANVVISFLLRVSATQPLCMSLMHVASAVVAQLASARLSEREVPGSILNDLNVCFDFPLIRVAIALNPLKTEH